MLLDFIPMPTIEVCGFSNSNIVVGIFEVGVILMTFSIGL
jgi:hypothetical protein